MCADSAKECVKLLLSRDPSRRPTASDILQHEWLLEHGCADDRPVASEVLVRLAQFSRMNRLKQQAMRVSMSVYVCMGVGVGAALLPGVGRCPQKEGTRTGIFD